MAVKTLVNDVQKILNQIRTARGPFILAMLYNRAEEANTGWNVIVAAPWADELGVADATGVIVRELSLKLGLENKTAISRVTVLKTDDSFVRAMNDYFSLIPPQGVQPLRNIVVDGVPIGSGYVFFSEGLVAK
jgi:hypothetical protein